MHSSEILKSEIRQHRRNLEDLKKVSNIGSYEASTNVARSYTEH